MTGDQLIVVISIAPDIVELDVGLLFLGIGNQVVYFFGNSLFAEPSQIRRSSPKNILW